MSESKIYKQIVSVMSDISAIDKTNRNTQQGFMFRGIDDVYNELHGLMAKHGIFTVPEIIEKNSTEKQTAKGTILYYEKYKMKYTVYADDGSNLFGVVEGIAMDSGDKAGNKAMAIAHKYFLLQLFCIPTKEAKDPDTETPPETIIKPQTAQTTTQPIINKPEPLKQGLKGEFKSENPQYNNSPTNQEPVDGISISAEITAVEEKTTKTGKKFYTVKCVTDNFETLSLSCWSDTDAKNAEQAIGKGTVTIYYKTQTGKDGKVYKNYITFLPF